MSSSGDMQQFRELIDLSLDAGRFLADVEAGHRSAPEEAIELAKRIGELDPLLSEERRELARTAMNAKIAFERGEIGEEECEEVLGEAMARSEDLDDEMLEAAEELADLLGATEA